MCINIKSYTQGASDIFKASRLPLSVLIISAGIFLFNQLYLKSTSPLGVILDQTSLASLAGAVFYFLTNTISDYKKKKIAQNFAISQYSVIKIDMINNFLSFLKKYRIDKQRLRENINNYAVIREYITKDDRYTISNNLDKVLVKQTLYYFRQLRDLLSLLASYDFVRSNKELYERVRFLHFWIEQFHNDFDLWYTHDDDHDFSKTFDIVIAEFVLGFSFTEGQRDKDDFIELLEKA